MNRRNQTLANLDVELECIWSIEGAAIRYARTLPRHSAEWFQIMATVDWLQWGGRYIEGATTRALVGLLVSRNANTAEAIEASGRGLALMLRTALSLPNDV